MNKEETKCYCGHTTYCNCIPLEVKIDILDFNQIVKEPKQEATPEEVAEYLGFTKGVEWQMERSYTEKEVLDLLKKFYQDDNNINGTIEEWFEQYKKK